MPGPSSIILTSLSSIVTLFIGVFIYMSIPGQIEISDPNALNGFNARTLPYFIAAAIVVLSLLIIISEVIKSQKSEEGESGQAELANTSYIRIFAAFISIAIWLALLPYVGFNIMTILLVASIMLLIGNVRWWQIAIVSVLLSLPLSYLFEIVLRVYLPQGSLFN